MMFWSNGKCTSTARLDGKLAIVTGSNTGIGKITAADFYKRGAHVIMACRSFDKAKTAIEDIKNECKDMANVGQIEFAELNLCSLGSVRKCAEQILEKHKQIDLLINNAGILTCPFARTEDGFEMQFGTNHLGHFLFTLLLMPAILNAKSPRIVNVSSVGHKWGKIDFDDLNWEKRKYDTFAAYAQSKLANILFTKELAKRFKDANINHVTVYSLHPGVIATDIGRHLKETYGRFASWLAHNNVTTHFVKTPLEGAQTTIYCSVDEKAGKETGLYYSDCKPKEPTSRAKNMDNANRLWEESLKLVDLQDFNIVKQ